MGFTTEASTTMEEAEEHITFFQGVGLVSQKGCALKALSLAPREAPHGMAAVPKALPRNVDTMPVE
jgi:hypothetical protein